MQRLQTNVENDKRAHEIVTVCIRRKGSFYCLVKLNAF